MAEKPYNSAAFQDSLIAQAREAGLTEDEINSVMRRSPASSPSEATVAPQGTVTGAQPAPEGMAAEVEAQSPSNVAPTREDKSIGTTFSPILSTDYSTLRDERIREMEAAEEADLGAGELWSLARENVTLGAGMERVDDLRGAEEDEAFLADKESLLMQDAKKFTDNELELLAAAVNHEDYEARKDQINNNRRRAEQLSDAGIRGFAYQMAAGMTDEALLPLYLATGGLGSLARGTLLSRTLSSGALGAVEGAAVEAVLKQTDTNRGWEDVVIGAVGGGLVSSAIPLGVAGFKRLRNGKQANIDPTRTDKYREAFEESRRVDEDLQNITRMYEIDRSLQDIEEAISITSVRNIDGRQQLVDELMPLAKNRMSKGDREVLLRERSQLENQLNQLKESRTRVPAVDPSGTKRIRARRAAERQGKLSGIDERIAKVKAKADDIDQRLKADQPLRDAWADISRLTNGVVPEHLKGKLLDSMEAQMSPLNRAELRRSGEMAETARKLREERSALEAERTPRVNEDGTVRTPTTAEKIADDSTGAMRVEGSESMDDIYDVPGDGRIEEMTAEAAQFGAATPRADYLRRVSGLGVTGLKSLYSRLDISPSDLIRGISRMLLSDPQLAGKGHVPAAIHQDTFMARILNEEGGREFEAKVRWANKNGVSSYKMHLGIGDQMKEFDNEVVLAMVRGGSDDPDIKIAAEARQSILEESLKYRKRYGVKGFENVKHDPKYWSVLPSGNKILKASRANTKEDVIETMTGAYMNGRLKLNEKSARIVAKAQYARAVNSTVKSRQAGVKSVLTESNIVALRADLEDLGVPTEQIDEFLESFSDVRAIEQVSNRAKLSLGAKIDYMHKGIRMVDLIDTDQNTAMKYAREASADAAMGTQGFKSRGEVESTIENIEKEAKNLLENEIELAIKRGDTKEEIATLKDQIDEVGEDADQLMDSVRLIYGESLDTTASGDIPFGLKGLRMNRKYTSLVRLSWNGPASISENSNSIVNNGLGTTMRNTKFKDFAAIGKIEESEDLKGMYKLIGAYGQRGAWIKNNNYLLDTMDEPGQGAFEKIFNNAYGFVSNKVQLLSGYRSIQHGSEDLALRGMQDRLVRMANGEITPRELDYENLERAGVSPDEIDTVFNHIRNNPEYATVDGEQIQIFTGDGLDEIFLDKLGAAFNSMLARNMQKSFVGDTPLWMSKEIGKLIVQFRAFSLIAIERQVIAGIRGDKIAMAQKVMWGTGLSAASYYGRAYAKAKADGDDFEESWKRATEPANVAMGVANMSPHLGLLGFGMELGATVGLTGGSGTSGSRSGARPITGFESLPAAGVLTQGSKGVQGTVSGIRSGDSEAAMKGLKKIYGITPIMNTAAVGVALGIANTVND